MNDFTIPKDDYEFVEKIAYKYFLKSNYYVELDDLIQEGLLAYIKERQKYDAEKNNFFMGYAYLRVSGAIKDYIGKNSPRGGATVRPNSVASIREVQTFSSMGMDENELEDEGYASIVDVLINEQYLEEFYRYFNTLNALEQKILHDYFILQRSVVKISEELQMSRLKVKKILDASLYYMKRYFHIEQA